MQSAPDASRSARDRPRGISLATRFVALLRLLHNATGFFPDWNCPSALDTARSARKPASRHRDVDKICRFAAGCWSVFTV